MSDYPEEKLPCRCGQTKAGNVYRAQIAGDAPPEVVEALEDFVDAVVREHLAKRGAAGSGSSAGGDVGSAADRLSGSPTAFDQEKP